MTDIEKYNRIVKGPIILKISKFDRQKVGGVGEKIAYLEGSSANVAAFISQAVNPYVICDLAGMPIVFCKNGMFGPAEHNEMSDYSKFVLDGLNVLVEDNQWKVELPEKPILLSFSRYMKLWDVGDEIGCKWNEGLPLNCFDRLKAKSVYFYFDKDKLPSEEDEKFSVR